MVADWRLRQCSSTGATAVPATSSVAKGRYPSMADSNREVARPNLVFCSRFRRQSEARYVALLWPLTKLPYTPNSSTGAAFQPLLPWDPHHWRSPLSAPPWETNSRYGAGRAGVAQFRPL